MPASPEINTCGCDAPVRRRCELCAAEPWFVACGLRCLEQHRRDRHGLHADDTSMTLAGASVVQMNEERGAHSNWDAFAPHRTRMLDLARAARRGEGICVLGAGNCNDIDIPLLIHDFGEVHLVDLDGAALARGIERVPEALRGKVHLHGGVDLTGSLAHIDEWGENFSATDQEIAARAAETSAAVATAVGGQFDVVLSTCVLSQLRTHFTRTLALQPQQWGRMFLSLALGHVATMVALTRPGGTAILVTDVLSSHIDASLRDFASPSVEDSLGAVMAERARSGAMKMAPDPRELMRLLREHPSLVSTVDTPTLTDPWMWDAANVLFLVYALTFRKV